MDSYDWVMIQNVYGMGSYADGGLTTTRTYISSGNYIMKMSDYKSGKWSEIWEALYYMFIREHIDKFEKIPRLGAIMIGNLKRKSKAEISEYEKVCGEFMAKNTKK
jgi:deoxyribodipyrimidine photolyase-related protein